MGRRSARLAALVFGVALTCAGCCWREYTGDGAMLKGREIEPAHKYVIDLGDIDLARGERRSFTFGGAPPRRCGISIVVQRAAYESLTKNHHAVHLVVREDGREVIRSAEAATHWHVINGDRGQAVLTLRHPRGGLDPRCGRRYEVELGLHDPPFHADPLPVRLRLVALRRLVLDP